ncbi:aminoglycoside N(3)-acetyltransferase [Paenibacillus glycinis]|uniref:Aminoglycoside N(3)-acetyltransferase n=1 Tax=Paenibacillus glycinis TaxID=2697035 RepID=A0ABW9XSW5_9BACL|nr:AAC(3) family N-acetyltransferase [Paenibacillus glycinis]NBD25705.1 aminoglycoside N(3)-acetyltransferase [Paenibacillus glycinis]
MREREIIANSAMPVTAARIVRDLRALGAEEGDTLLVHASLSSLGWVCGGPQAVVQALLETVGEAGTIVMPAQSGDWSDPAEWSNPPVPAEWLEAIYRDMPAFDPLTTPTRGMGRIAELFRTFPGSVRSQHPQASFSANGNHAAAIVADHPLTPQFGMASPLGKLYGLRNAKVLLLGAGYGACTAFHLAESLLPDMPAKKMGTAMTESGARTWKWFTDFAYDSADFSLIGAVLDERGELPASGRVGGADCRLFGLRAGVDAAGEWLRANRIQE